MPERSFRNLTPEELQRRNIYDNQFQDAEDAPLCFTRCLAERRFISILVPQELWTNVDVSKPIDALILLQPVEGVNWILLRDDHFIRYAVLSSSKSTKWDGEKCTTLPAMVCKKENRPPVYLLKLQDCCPVKIPLPYTNLDDAILPCIVALTRDRVAKKKAAAEKEKAAAEKAKTQREAEHAKFTTPTLVPLVPKQDQNIEQIADQRELIVSLKKQNAELHETVKQLKKQIKQLSKPLQEEKQPKPENENDVKVKKEPCEVPAHYYRLSGRTKKQKP